MHVLELLERDREFRCAVAGYIGISEVLKRLDELIEEERNLRDEQRDLREEQTKTWWRLKPSEESTLRFGKKSGGLGGAEKPQRGAGKNLEGGSRLLDSFSKRVSRKYDVVGLA